MALREDAWTLSPGGHEPCGGALTSIIALVAGRLVVLQVSHLKLRPFTSSSNGLVIDTFIPSFSRYLLKISSGPGAIPGIRYIAMNRTGRVTVLWDLGSRRAGRQ